MGLQVVHVRTCSMNLRADAMPCAMEEILSETILLNKVSRLVVHLITSGLLAGFYFFEHKVGCLDPRISDHLEYVLDCAGHYIAAEPSPRNVIIGSSRLGQFGPQIYQGKICPFYCESSLPARLIMRIRRIGIHRHYWAMIRHQPSFLKVLADKLLNIEFGYNTV